MQAKFGVFAVLATAWVFSLSAAPVVENVVVSQEAGSPCARITYSLTGDDAIVTMDVKTNGVSIGGANIQYLVGDVNAFVTKCANGERKWILWDVSKSWPGHAITDNGVTVELRTWTRTSPPPYMAVWLECAANQNYYADASFVPGGVEDVIYKTERMLFRFIPAKGRTFRMGSQNSEPNRGAYEDSHYTSFLNDYWIAVYEMTQRQNQLLTGSMTGPSAGDITRAICPAERMSGEYVAGGKYDIYGGVYDNFNAAGPVRQIRNSIGIKEVAFPTEAQWEFAARAGSDSPLYGIDSEVIGEAYSNHLDRIAWYAGNSDGVTHPVGEKEPNAFGLYDMIGNAEEQVWDQYVEWHGYDTEIEPFNKYPMLGNDYWGWTMREFRGGHFASAVGGARCAARHKAGTYQWPKIDAANADQMKAGFRPAITIVD